MYYKPQLTAVKILILSCFLNVLERLVCNQYFPFHPEAFVVLDF